jgi:hypothetical protein
VNAKRSKTDLKVLILGYRKKEEFMKKGVEEDLVTLRFKHF